MKRTGWSAGLILCAVVFAACSSAFSMPTYVETPTPSPTVTATPTGAGQLPGNLDTVHFIEDDTEYIIVQMLPRDGIKPIYRPEFASAEEAPYGDDDLVMGVEINGDARAYAVGILRSQEMVNDEVGGTPVLVTW